MESLPGWNDASTSGGEMSGYDWIVGGIAVILLILFLCLFSYIYHSQWLFEYKNHRRYCKRCGQQQDHYMWAWDWGNQRAPGWWEDMCPIRDENCLCHKFAGQ